MNLKATPHINPKVLGYISLAIVLVGILLRVNVYLQNRSLRIDEANLARNIVEKSYGEFFQSLDYAQYAPPLYSITAKAATAVIGVNEYALRLPALIGGILSLLLLLLLVNRLSDTYPARWYILLLFSFSMMALQYSTELKQYSTDAALTLLFVYLAFQDRNTKINLQFSLKWTILGSLGIWYSMPLIFILATIGLAFLIKSWKEEKTAIPYLVGMGGVWLLNFGLYYYLILRQDAGSDYLQNYHAQYFLNFFPSNSTAFWKDLSLVEGLFRSLSDQTAISIIWTMASFALGAILLLRKQRFIAFLLLMPIFLCLLASHLQLYSLIERMTLFMIPLFLLVIGIGIHFLWQKTGYFKWLFLIPMLISVINTKGYQYFTTHLEIEDSKGAMRYLVEHRKEKEWIFVQHDGLPAFFFYNNLYDRAWHFENYYAASWEEDPATKFAQQLAPDTNFWLFLSHTFPAENIQKQLDFCTKIGTELQRFESVGASVYQFQLKK